MHVEMMPVGPFEANCYLAWGETRQALVIDPGADAERVLRLLDRHNLTVAAYLLTHGHMDHIGALAPLAALRPAPIGLHPDDARWAFEPANQMPPYYPVPERPSETARPLADGQEWTDGGLTYRILATPGHSPGSVCYYFPSEHALFTGDTLFQGTVGRTDLPGGATAVLSRSLERLAKLPPETRIYAGHGAASTLAEELRSNPFLQMA